MTNSASDKKNQPHISLREPHNPLVHIADSLPVLIGYVDNTQTYRFANKCHETWFQIPVGDIEGKHISDVVGRDQYNHLLPYIEAALLGKATEFEMQIHHKGIGNAHMRVSYIPDNDSLGNIKGFSLVSEDITKLKHQAATAIYAKNAFLATMSHEIRTPLNGILGMTELLLNTELNDRQLKYANTVCRSGEGLLEIINDILDFCKIEAGEMEIEYVFFNIRDIAQDVVNSLMPKAQEKNNILKLHFSTGTPSNAVGDPDRLHQLLTNLVSNAIKFTTNGNIDVNITHQGRNEQGVKFLFEVHDTGIGISADKLEHIFDKFSQVDGSNTRKFGGTGLGLAICHKITGLMGGTIGVESAEGEGSTFWFSLCMPAEEVTLSSLRVAITSLQGNDNDALASKWSTFKGVHILLADDDILNQQIMASMLELMKCRISIASNGKEAIRLLWQEDTFDLVLMDCEMPELDGYDATRIIKQTSNLPIVALTTSLQHGDKNRCFNAGMDDCLSKPIKHDELEKMLLKWISEEKLARTA